MIMKMYIEGKKIVRVMHQNCITPKAYKEIYDANDAMDLIISSSKFENMQEEWMNNHTELFDEDGDCPREVLNQMADECASVKSMNSMIAATSHCTSLTRTQTCTNCLDS